MTKRRFFGIIKLQILGLFGSVMLWKKTNAPAREKGAPVTETAPNAERITTAKNTRRTVSATTQKNAALPTGKRKGKRKCPRTKTAA